MPNCDCEPPDPTAFERRTKKGDFARNYKGYVTKWEWEYGYRKCISCRDM